MSRLPWILALAAVAAVVAFLVLNANGDEPGLVGPGEVGRDGPAPAVPDDLPPPRYVREDEDASSGNAGPVRPGPGPRPLPDDRPVVSDLDEVRALMEAKDLSSALLALDRRLEADREDVAVLALRGRLQLQMGRKRAADRDLTRAAQLAEPGPAELLTHAEAKLGLGRLEEAEALVRRSLTLEPDQARAHAVLAVIRIRQKQPAAAEAEIREALRLDPEEPLAKMLSGRLERR